MFLLLNFAFCPSFAVVARVAVPHDMVSQLSHPDLDLLESHGIHSADFPKSVFGLAAFATVIPLSMNATSTFYISSTVKPAPPTSILV